MQLPDKELIGPSEASRRKDVARTTVYRAIDEGKINSFKVAGRTVIVVDDCFEQWTIDRDSIPFAHR
jgi:excisionase family DNA binding protein